jgi:hypothetical protein
MKRIALLVVLALSLPPAGAMVRGTTVLGGAFVSGGAGSEEMGALTGEKAQYALAILTAAKGSGAFLADVQIRITDANARPVLDTVMDGPWLLVALPAGRYLVEAVLNAKVQKAIVSVSAGEHLQTVFYFDTGDQVESGAQQMEVLPGS